MKSVLRRSDRYVKSYKMFTLLPQHIQFDIKTYPQEMGQNKQAIMEFQNLRTLKWIYQNNCVIKFLFKVLLLKTIKLNSI